MAFVLPDRLCFVALVDSEAPAGYTVAAPLLLNGAVGAAGPQAPEFVPLMPGAEQDVAFIRREQILFAYRPHADLQRQHFEAAMRLSPTVRRCVASSNPPPAPPPPPQAAPTPPAPKTMIFRESQLAHHFLDGLEGVEIGGSAHNPFGLRTRNVDYTDDMTTVFKRSEVELCGRALPVDIVAPGDDLPLEDASTDFVISSHVLEHFYDPIGALKEWYRVIRPGGYIFAVVPHKERTIDKERPRTTLRELIERHAGTRPMVGPDLHEHHSVWITEDLVELVHYLGWNLVAVQDVDDKVGNGFTIVIRKA